MNPLGNAYKATNSVILGQKFYNAYNTIYQALTAYRKHLPTGALNGMPPKFRELLDLIIKLNEMYNSVCDKPCVGETMIDVSVCKVFIEKVKDFFVSCYLRSVTTCSMIPCCAQRAWLQQFRNIPDVVRLPLEATHQNNKSRSVYPCIALPEMALQRMYLHRSIYRNL